MAYDKAKIFLKAKELVITKNLIFIEDIIALLPIGKTSFYEYFSVTSNEMNELKELLEENRVNLKVNLRKKWLDSDNATLQMGLMKLVANPEELKRLSLQYIEQPEDKNDNITKIKWGDNEISI